jgi:hypothetical protein
MGVPENRRQLEALYLPPTDEFVVIDVPEMQFAMLDGTGDHDSDAFTQGSRWLWTAIDPIKRVAKQRMGKSFAEPPIEVLWWADDMNDFIAGNRDKFKWRQMIVTADWVDQEMFAAGVAAASTRLGSDPPAGLRLERFNEGLCVQIMHIGQESAAWPIMARLHNEWLPQHKFVAHGYHHEIYLSDPRRVAPEKIKTVLRQPVRRLS